MQIDKILKTIIDNLVEDKDSVSIECKEENDKVNFSVKVNKKDMGRIIGKQGKTANSIRTLMKSIRMLRFSRMRTAPVLCRRRLRKAPDAIFSSLLHRNR